MSESGGRFCQSPLPRGRARGRGPAPASLLSWLWNAPDGFLGVRRVHAGCGARDLSAPHACVVRPRDSSPNGAVYRRPPPRACRLTSYQTTRAGVEWHSAGCEPLWCRCGPPGLSPGGLPCLVHPTAALLPRVQGAHCLCLAGFKPPGHMATSMLVLADSSPSAAHPLPAPQEAC